MSDWESVTIIRKSGTNPRTLKSESAVNAAKRAGVAVTTEKKIGAIGTVDASKLAKIDRETEDFHITKVDLSLSQIIMKARQKLGVTQKDLATKINEKPQVIGEYESGKAVPNQQVLGKLERVLGVKLRGKDIGQPFSPRGTAAVKK